MAPEVCRRAVVGFSGPRDLSREFVPLVRRVVASVVAAGRIMAVGDARGLDAFVRAAAGPSWVAVARVSRRDLALRGKGAFAARSVRLVRELAARRFFRGTALVGFVSSPCPGPVFPSSSWVAGGSGTWSSLALAAGRRVPVFLFWCAPGLPRLPSWWGGSWVRCSSPGVWSSAWRFVPARRQASSVLPGSHSQRKE